MYCICADGSRGLACLAEAAHESQIRFDLACELERTRDIFDFAASIRTESCVNPATRCADRCHKEGFDAESNLYSEALRAVSVLSREPTPLYNPPPPLPKNRSLASSLSHRPCPSQTQSHRHVSST